MNNLFGGGKTPQSKSTKRIGYIDAIRGFTILLVVMSHVSGFGLGFNGSNTFSYRIIVESFFIPLFFFISGFVLYKTDRIWTVINTWKFLVGKVSFLLVAPLIFMLALSQVKGNTFIEILFSNMKGGYWFTFSLFEYYVIYAVSRQLGFYMKFKNLVEDVFLLIIGFTIYLCTIWTLMEKLHMMDGIGGLFCVPNLHYYIFLVLGTLAKKHIIRFEILLDTKYFTALLIAVFIVCHLVPSLANISSTVYSFVSSLSGVLLVFAFFRYYRTNFEIDDTPPNKFVERQLMFVGRRTLDIYFIHYFFIFSNMEAVLPNMAMINSPFIELFISLFLSLIIVVISLSCSTVIRINPWLAHCLFGEKIKRK